MTLKYPYKPEGRELNTIRLSTDLVVLGGGMAGTCCAITAARQGIKVVLVQDRPVLGGNASSEVRLWVLGATSHMGNNNRWAREGGVIDEVLVENLYRNQDGNALIFDSILLEKVHAEPNITLLLNTAVYELTKQADDRIDTVRAFCSQNSTVYDVKAGLFVDATGDGIVGFMAGAAFRIGAESASEFDEKLAPPEPRHELLGHSLYFYSKDVGRPTRFVPPAFALKDITKIPRYRRFNSHQHGCELWWIEHGGLLDTVHDTERIKWDLWQIVYGVWDHIKNSGQFPEAETLTLEWVGMIPGKRESRRFEGDYILSQRDIVEQRCHDDAVSYGGWAIDLHPAEGVFGDGPTCTQWHSKGVYQIPLRCLYSRNISNLLLAGRIISSSHVAFGSTRVMATCAHNAQAVGVAAAICIEHGLDPNELLDVDLMRQLQARLLRSGQHIPGVTVDDSADLAPKATVTASSTYTPEQLEPDAEYLPLSGPHAMMIPVNAGRVPQMGFWLMADGPTEVEVQLRIASKKGNFTPDVILATRRVAVKQTFSETQINVSEYTKMYVGVRSTTQRKASQSNIAHGATAPRSTTSEPQQIMLDFDVVLDEDQYVFVCLMANPAVSVQQTDRMACGVLRLSHSQGRRVSIGANQEPPEKSGIDAFEFWLPERRPKGKNLAMVLDPPIACYSPEDITRNPDRPTTRPNVWVADPNDASPTISLNWPTEQTIRRIEVTFDTDVDHPMESVLMSHPEEVMPACVRNIQVRDHEGRIIGSIKDNYQTRRTLYFKTPIHTRGISIETEHPNDRVPATLVHVRCYEN